MIRFALLTFMVAGCYGYRYGPPMSACADMWPEGHNADARADQTPFSITVNATSYRPGDVIEGTRFVMRNNAYFCTYFTKHFLML